MRAPGLTRNRAVLGCVVAACVGFGVIERVLLLRSPLGWLQTDEATWGLMANHVLGGEISAFFWGQSYGGTAEVFPVAGLFAIFGTHVFLMRLVPMILGVACSAIVWVIGRRMLGPTQGITAALLCWVWPIYAVWKIEVWSGFYAAGIVCVALVLLLAFSVDDDPTTIRVALLGFVIGVSFWESLQTVAVILPTLLWLVLRRRKLLRQAHVAALGSVVGALPWLLSNLRHDWWSFHPRGGEPRPTSCACMLLARTRFR